MFVTDHTTGKQAKVDAKNNVYTATRDATTGAAAKVNAFGQQLVAVSGSVTATPLPPGRAGIAIPR